MAKGAKFQPGQSGNPKGRPPGTGKTAKLRALLEPDAPKLVQKARELALEGDTAALRLCIERLIPPLKTRDEAVTVNGLRGDQSLTEQGSAIVNALAAGQVTPSEAASLMQTVTAQARIIEIEDLAARIERLEKQQ